MFFKRTVKALLPVCLFCVSTKEFRVSFNQKIHSPNTFHFAVLVESTAICPRRCNSKNGRRAYTKICCKQSARTQPCLQSLGNAKENALMANHRGIRLLYENSRHDVNARGAQGTQWVWKALDYWFVWIIFIKLFTYLNSQRLKFKLKVFEYVFPKLTVFLNF